MPAAALGPSSVRIARRFLNEDVRAKIQQAVAGTPVVLFMKGTPDAPQCGFSRAAVQVLGIHGVPAEKMKTFNVLEDSVLRESIKEFSYVFIACTAFRTREVYGCGIAGTGVADIGPSSDWPTIPQLYVNGEFVGGCDILINSTSCLTWEKHQIVYVVEYSASVRGTRRTAREERRHPSGGVRGC